ncbi:MAG TPA: hypothetical protein ENN80_10335 [Candidatus Hydrogenedentes bacterium]|nr:hypothetical protein [Candidatus Hydrogenedentota bacterium]
MTFLERLQASEQSLRIDAFQISRSPMSDAVSCMLEVTRTVVDGAPETPRSGPASDQRNGTIRVGLGERVEAWKTAHCELARVADEAALGPDCVRARAEKSDASLSLPVELDTGADYVLFVDLKATAPASLGVRPQGNNQSDRSNIDVPGDGKRRQYHLRFSVPGPPGRQTVFEAPVIAFGEENGEVLVDGIVLRKTVG